MPYSPTGIDGTKRSISTITQNYVVLGLVLCTNKNSERPLDLAAGGLSQLVVGEAERANVGAGPPPLPSYFPHTLTHTYTHESKTGGGLGGGRGAG